MDQNQMNQHNAMGDAGGAPQSGAPMGQGSQMPPEQPGMPEQPNEDKKSAGPIVGIIIVVVVIVLGGVYYFLTQTGVQPTPEEILNQEDTALEALQTQDTSDEIADIEEDLGATELENLDAELEQIDQELSF